VGHSPR